MMTEPIYTGNDLPDIVHLQANEDGYWTNLPLLVKDLCKQGKEDWRWGDNSIGANDLALNILEWAYRRRNYHGRRIVVLEGECYTEAFLLHHDFKIQVVARVPLQGQSFTVDEVWGWVTEIAAPLHRWLNSLEDDEDNEDEPL